jgi:guanine deaminase
MPALRLKRSHSRKIKATTINNPFSIATLLYLATAGGAAVCDIEEQVGSFGLGKSFDALLVNVGENNLNPAVWGTATPRHGADAAGAAAEAIADAKVRLEEKKQIVNDWLERFMHGGDDRNIEKVYVQGRFVGGRTFPS